MKSISVAAASLNQTALDWDGNLSRILSAIDEAKSLGAELLVCPELCLSGYGCEDMFYSEAVVETSCDLLKEVAKKASDIVLCVGLPLRHEEHLYNTVCVIADRKILGFSAKRNLARSGIHYEPRWFTPWTRSEPVEVALFGECIPLGDLIYQIDDIRFGLEICEDAWVRKRLGTALAAEKVDIILNPSASHFAIGKFETRKALVRNASKDFGVGYIFSNLLGNEAGRAIYDGDTILASEGEIIAQGPRFSFRDTVVTQTVIDIEKNRELRKTLELGDLGAKLAYSVIHSTFSFKKKAPKASQVTVADWENCTELKEQEFLRSVSLGLFDYLRKSHSQGFVVSLSGGADSTVTACLIALMIRLSHIELGESGVREKLSHIPTLEALKNEQDRTEALLTCIYQATANSSIRTRNAAEVIAGRISADFIECNIAGIVSSYVELCELTTDTELNWSNNDLALQNIQARARGPFAWLIANIKNALLLATSNRSEAAVGYTTMDGDTCGGLSPIAGIDKAFLLHWLRWVESGGVAEYGAIAELALVTSQAPTAELRPAEASQTDEQDLMPYLVLDAIERLAIGEKLMPAAVFNQLKKSFPDKEIEQLREWVVRFFQLWSRNQWKRERYAPSFHLDDQNLDPKTWCRFPILSGGYERELKALMQQ